MMKLFLKPALRLFIIIFIALCTAYASQTLAMTYQEALLELGFSSQGPMPLSTDILKNWKKLSAKWHPDKNKENVEAATEKIKNINNAKELLMSKYETQKEADKLKEHIKNYSEATEASTKTVKITKVGRITEKTLATNTVNRLLAHSEKNQTEKNEKILESASLSNPVLVISFKDPRDNDYYYAPLRIIRNYIEDGVFINPITQSSPKILENPDKTFMTWLYFGPNPDKFIAENNQLYGVLYKSAQELQEHSEDYFIFDLRAYLTKNSELKKTYEQKRNQAEKAYREIREQERQVRYAQEEREREEQEAAKNRAEEVAEGKRQEELERKRLEELERKKQEEELERKQKEELERKRLEEERERQRQEKERKQKEELERKRLEEERKQKEERERQRQEEERKQKEELERKRLEEERERQRQEEERQRLEELDRKKREEEINDAFKQKYTPEQLTNLENARKELAERQSQEELIKKQNRNREAAEEETRRKAEAQKREATPRQEDVPNALTISLETLTEKLRNLQKSLQARR